MKKRRQGSKKGTLVLTCNVLILPPEVLPGIFVKYFGALKYCQISSIHMVQVG
jgi:hypothetical protein